MRRFYQRVLSTKPSKDFYIPLEAFVFLWDADKRRFSGLLSKYHPGFSAQITILI